MILGRLWPVLLLWLALLSPLVIAAETDPETDSTADTELSRRLQRLEAELADLKAAQAGKPAAAPSLIQSPTPSAAPSSTPAPEPRPEPALAAKPAASATEFSYSGYIKLDLLFSEYSDGEVPGNNSGRDFYVPSTIPVAAAADDEQPSRFFDAHAKQTRFGFQTRTALANGEAITSTVEFDFINRFDGDERVSNGYSPALRHAYFSYGNWLAGQTWFNSMDLAAMPDTVGFIGASEGAVFGRQAQLRYSNGGLSVALENPETTYTPYGGGVRQSADDDSRPDLSLRYVHKFSAGHLSLAAVQRQLRYDSDGNQDSTSGYGLKFSGKWQFDADDLRWMLVHGDGFGRYVGLNTGNDAVLDAQGDLQPLALRAGFVAWRHLWAPAWRSTLLLSRLHIDNPVELTVPDVSQRANSAHLNLIWSPVQQLELGIEFIRAERELASGDSGTLHRLQFMAKHSFK